MEESNFAYEYSEWHQEFTTAVSYGDNGDTGTGPEQCYDGNFEFIPGCKCHSSCGACGYYDWPDADDDCVYCPDGSEVEAVYDDGTGYCSSSSSGSSEEEMPVWYNFIVNDEMGSWAVVATYDEEFESFYLWTGGEEACLLIPDWKSENREDNIWGFFV